MAVVLRYTLTEARRIRKAIPRDADGALAELAYALDAQIAEATPAPFRKVVKEERGSWMGGAVEHLECGHTYRRQFNSRTRTEEPPATKRRCPACKQEHRT